MTSYPEVLEEERMDSFKKVSPKKSQSKKKKSQNGSTSSMLVKVAFTPTAALQGVPLDMDLHEGDEVTLTSECVKLYAEEISFCLLSHKELCSSVSFIQFLKEQLVVNSLLLCTGMCVFIHYLSQEIVLKVQNVKLFAVPTPQCSKTPFQCIWQTQVFAESVTESNSIPMKGISFEDIGGYQHELQTLHHQVDMLFSTTVTNVKPVKGILISGPSGCGKSLIGKALKTKYGNKCVSMQLDDVKSKFRGETEQRMKQLFDKALNRSPCLLFIDDLDMLCSSRDKGGDTGIVTALLHLMDGLGTTSEGIIVIATAVKPQTLDAALRRPGRLSYDVMLSSPNEAARRDILQKLLVNVPSDIEETDLATLAANAHGYTGGDLRSIVMEAVMQAEGKRLTKQDLEASLVAIKPAALRDSTTVQKQVKLSDICGHDVIKSKLHESLSLTLAHGPVFQKCSISPPSRFLLFGPPGCGKSFIIMALATEFHLNVISVKRSTVLGKYFGESEQNLANIFMQANNSSPCIIHFENFDGLAGIKTGGENGGTDVESRIINHLKVQLDGIVRNDGIFIFAETNRPDLLNKDVIRPGRFHEYYFVDLPDPNDRCLILYKHLQPCTFLDDISFESLVNQTTSFTVSEILQFCEEVKIRSRRENEVRVSDSECTVITGAALDETLEFVIPNTSQRIIQKHKSFACCYGLLSNRQCSY
ncbi:ATPase family gene 2 protein homolog A isoform X3 [Cherax quadricarinatus]|uniref:ATPase family gene 2 protein homolog A isoform X3 n=1 Tax=Cherax quadricarinatus TaxID=27406 RepID=UPI00387E6AF3